MRWDVVVAVSPHTALQKHVKNPAQCLDNRYHYGCGQIETLSSYNHVYIYMWVQSHKQTYYYIYQ